MRSFEYACPTDLKDAVALLSDRWGPTELLGGGVDLTASLKQGIIQPERVVSLKGLKTLRGIEVGEAEVRIGAMTSLAEISEHTDLQREFPALVHAIDSIGSSQIVNMGSLGGNLCQRPRCWYFRQGFGLLGQLDGNALVPDGDNRYHAVFGNQGPAYFVNPSSLAPALIALDATVAIAAAGGTRRTALAEFYRIPERADQREFHLQPNEIVTEVVIPRSSCANATYKVRQRQGLDWPLVTASVAFADRQAARKARVVLGHVAPKPWPSPAAAALLEGKPVNDALAKAVAAAAAQGATPLSKNAYKISLIKTAVRRALLIAAGLMEA